ncbi:MAG: hypothetical protein DMG15_04315 [Acidobacteria bacterium]|nr:MAG: hypothetical protein DMG16_09865 [Acidobacteriota bacterium]PYS15715.1 MAG: hypothetical protein DMG15_04315 [Acidobacteriota bacterium]
MRQLLLASAAALLVGIGAEAQQPAAQVCPPGGYTPPMYGVFGQNGGGGQTSYEIASPCIPKEVRDAAEAIGMGRTKPLGVKNVITVMFSAEGALAGQGGMDKLSKAEFHINYVVPAMRMFLNGTRADGKPLAEIRVFADTWAWNEAKEGVGASAAMATLAERAPLVKLTPFGALWSIIEAEGHVKVGTVASKTTFTGTSPYDGMEVTMTLDTKQRPDSVTVKANGHVYGATFADYRDNWEPAYLVIFPSEIHWTKDNRPLADLKVTAFKSNPYVVFPVPEVVKQKSN